MKRVIIDKGQKYLLDIEPTADTDEIEGLHISITLNDEEYFEGLIPKRTDLEGRCR